MLPSDLRPLSRHEADVTLGRLAPDHPATRRTVWVTIVNATSYPANMPIPYSYHAFAATENRGPFVTLHLDTATEAETWARWVNTDYHASWSPDGGVTFFAERSGWRWHLYSSPPAVEQQERVAAACLLPDMEVVAS